MCADVDYAYSRQADDLTALGKGLKAFEKDMKKVMVLMTDLGTSLESVSHSFDALTSLSFTDEEVKRYVHHFSQAVVEMKQGAAFQNYNRLVHEEVLQPVQALKKSLKETEAVQTTRSKALKKRQAAREKVDKTESSYASKGKSLDECHKYPELKAKRDATAESFRGSDEVFQDSFRALIHGVEEVTRTTMKRYLELNAGYMSSVMDTLVKTDPTVTEAVDLYRRQLHQERQSEIARQRVEVARELSRLPDPPSMDVSPVQVNPANTSIASLPNSSSRRRPRVSAARPGALTQDSSAVLEPLSQQQPATLTKRRPRTSVEEPVLGGPPAALDDGAKRHVQDAAATSHVDPQANTATAASSSPLTAENLQPMRPAPPGPAQAGDKHSDNGSDAPSTVVPESGYFSAQKRELANDFRNALEE